MALAKSLLVTTYNINTDEEKKVDLTELLTVKYKDGNPLYQAKYRYNNILMDKGHFTIEINGEYYIVFIYPLEDRTLLEKVNVNTCRFIIDPIKGEVVDTESITNIMLYNLPDIKNKYKIFSSRYFSVRSLRFKITLLDYLEKVSDTVYKQ